MGSVAEVLQQCWRRDGRWLLFPSPASPTSPGLGFAAGDVGILLLERLWEQLCSAPLRLSWKGEEGMWSAEAGKGRRKKKGRAAPLCSSQIPNGFPGFWGLMGSFEAFSLQSAAGFIPTLHTGFPTPSTVQRLERESGIGNETGSRERKEKWLWKPWKSGIHHLLPQQGSALTPFRALGGPKAQQALGRVRFARRQRRGVPKSSPPHSICRPIHPHSRRNQANLLP